MKLKLFITAFFIFATTLTALHELEHIEGHDASTCQICIVDNHNIFADVVHIIQDPQKLSHEEVLHQITLFYFQRKLSTNQNRAPPSFS